MRKTYSEYITYIKRMLGSIISDNDNNSLEFLDEDLHDYVNIAFSEVKPYINVKARATLPFINDTAIDLKKFNLKVKTITKVRRGSAQGYLNSPAMNFENTTDGTYPDINLFSLGYTGGYYAYGYNINIDPWSTEKLMIKGINETSEDGHYIFDYERQLLFVHFNPKIPNSVTIDFTPEFNTIEDVYDDYWVMLLQKYALGVTKKALSQYRGKYSRVDGAPFELDYNRLQREGEEELNKLNEILEENLLDYRFS